MKKLLLALLFANGCMAYASPAPPMFCMEMRGQDVRCDAEYIWIPGYWAYDGWGRTVWIPGRYASRWNVRDHRR